MFNQDVNQKKEVALDEQKEPALEAQTFSNRTTMEHVKARIEKPDSYPDRFPVSDDKVSWRVDYSKYKPPYFTDPDVIQTFENLEPCDLKKLEALADPANRKLLDEVNFESYEGTVNRASNGLPSNPFGRTGIEGRGELWNWGANFAADPVITRKNPDTGAIEMLAIERRDSGEWAIPGGMVDPGERITKTLKRELKEEAGVEIDFDNGEVLYRGYVDDRRNTDNAWMETTVSHIHLSEEEAKVLNPKAGSDAKKVTWLEVNEDMLSKLYASHGEFVRLALARLENK